MLHFPPFRLDIVNGLLWRGEQTIPLSPKPQAVLRYLIEKKDRIVSSNEIRQAVWQGTIVNPEILKVSIQAIRKALKDNPKHPQFIETIPGVGYRFLGALQNLGPRDQHKDESVTAGDSAEGVDNSSQAYSLQSQAPLFVGRDAELARLYGWLNKALAGQRQIIFVSGEPGLGKTALVHAFQHQLAATFPQIWTALGRCLERFGAGEAYLPILDALTQLQTEQQRLVLIPLLQQHAPSWLAQLPSLISQEQRALISMSPIATRERMLREFAYMIEALTAQAPLVLILEDLHWSDSSTLNLLVALAQRQDPARLLLIGTYRPEVVYADNHPFRSVFYELQAHRLCAELPLTPWTATETHSYLTANFPTNTFPSELIGVLQERTEGNPLFLTSLLETFVNRGVFNRHHGAWVLTQPLTALTTETPESFRFLLERQIERLTEEEQQILAAASVVGIEFSAAAVAYALERDVVSIEAHCDSLARRRQFLCAAGDSEWPDGERAAQYAFLHALTREAWSERIPATQKQHLHQRVGERLAAAYRTREGEIAGTLAIHFEAGRDTQRAVRYHHIAGEKASAQFAYHEAIAHFSSALSLLRASPDAAESATLELQLQLALTHPLIAVKGWAAAETQQAYQRAHELSSTVGGPPERFTTLFGLWLVAYTRAELPRAHELARQLLDVIRRHRDPTRRMEASHTLGNTLHRMGNLRLARHHLERGITLYDRQRHRLQTLLYGLDNGVAGFGYAAWVLWALGYIDQARYKTDAMLALAQELSHPLNLAWALNSAAWHCQFQRNSHAAQQYAEAEIALCEEHDFSQLHAVGLIVQGWALASQEQPREGIRLMETGLTAVTQTGAAIGRPRYLTALAEAYAAARQTDKALSLLSQAEQCMTVTGEYFYAAELHRLRGELLLNTKGNLRRANAILSSSPTVYHAAEKSFQKAIAIARQQRAKSFELRAVMSLCKLQQLQGQEESARQSLRKIYDWFKEGYNTPDLRAARELLAELNQQAAAARRASDDEVNTSPTLSQIAS
jgi:DNA-binding winged helix-turn-helix (wHTH) protein/predicted ATPase